MRRQVGTGKTNASEPLLKHRNLMVDVETGVVRQPRDEPGGGPLSLARRRPACRWREPGLLRHAEQEKACPDTARPAVGAGERECFERPNPEGSSTDAGRAGGLARSSGDAPVTGAERRGRAVRDGVRSINRKCSGRSRVDTLKSQAKPFDISKSQVWEAYREVRANNGAPGVDGQSLADVRAGSCGKPVQDLESDVVRDVLPAAGARGGDPQDTRTRGADAGRAHRRRPGGADRGGPASGGAGGTCVPRGLLRISARALCA